MVRVGALRRISKSLLPHSLHAVDSNAKSNAVSELKDMLAVSTLPLRQPSSKESLTS